VDPRIVHWFAQNRIDDGVTFSRSQRTIQLVRGVKPFLVLLVEKRDLRAVSFRPTKGTGGYGHFLPPNQLIGARQPAKYHLGM
jgi:hypothetical protein